MSRSAHLTAASARLGARGARPPLSLPASAQVRAMRRISLLALLTLPLVGAYTSYRIAMVMTNAGARIPDIIMAAALLLAELFMAIHAVGYFGSMMKATRLATEARPPLFVPPATASVAVLVTSFNESEDVLEQTLSAVVAMDYPAMHVYLLDDSTRPECASGTQRLAAQFGATLVHRTNRAGYKAGAINDLLPSLTEEYIAILDADQRPVASWLKDIVPLLERDPELAMVQAPQIYVNGDGLPVATAATFQQAIFFEYICEGKSRSNAMFCCGSNVVLRRSALLSVERLVRGRRNFFDETSVTEDFATSVNLHAKGWKTTYVNRPYVLGMGPETLPAYFTQQMRWARGTLGVGLSLLRQIVQQPRRLRPAQWWEYLLSGTYYFVGFANLVFLLAPVLFLVFDVRPLQGDARTYLLVLFLYLVFTLNLVFYGMRVRGYPASGVWLSSALSFCTFWTYIKAGLSALFGMKKAFGVTPKGVGGSVPISQMLPEFMIFLACLLTAAAGIMIMAAQGPSVAYMVNTFWAAYHAAVLSLLFFYLNKPVTIVERRRVFEPALAPDSPPVRPAA